MHRAIVLISTELATEYKVRQELRKLPYVREASVVAGVYDIVARVEAETMDELKEIIFYKLRKVENVRSTNSMICAHE